MEYEPSHKEKEYQALRNFLKLSKDPKRKTTADFVRLAIEEELSTKQQQYVELYYLRQMTMHEIAKQCGVVVSTVSRTLSRARARLLHCLKYAGPKLNYLLGDDD